jgi:hypothetical protein
MKSTKERLKSSYCVPKGAEWDAFGLIPLTGHKVMWLGGEPTLVSGEFTDRTEIPVSHFIDLLNDSIVPWRLEEDSFDIQDGITYFETVAGSFRIEADGDVSHIVTGRTANVTTYTDLLTLIRLIG